MTKEEAKKFGLQLLHGIMERNESYPVYANNVKRAINALSEQSGSLEISNDLEEAAQQYAEGPECTWVETTALEEAFKAGAKWMENEINKELIRAAEKVHEIRDVDYGIHVDTAAYGSFETTSFYKNGKLVGQEQSKKED